MKADIIPSILSLDEAEIQGNLNILEKYFKTVQIDVMDGKFVPQKRFSPDFVSKLKTTMQKEAHLMVDEPDKLVDEYIKAGAKTIIFHIEAVKNPFTLIKKLKNRKIKVGIAVNPETGLQKVKPYLDKIDQLLIMTVNPGKGGQKLIQSMLNKVKEARKLSKKLIIEVDGGINNSNIKEAISAGANYVVVGSALVDGDLKKNIKEFKELIR